MYLENSDEDIVANKLPLLIQTLERYLDFKRWGFRLVYSGVFSGLSPCLIYQSIQCLIRFEWHQGRPHEETRIDASYGRLHAPFDQNIIVWNGEKCYCWHIVNKVLNFLDGLDPKNMSIDDFMMPRVIRDFYKSNKDRKWESGEYTAREQATIWNHYGSRLFDLFDLQRSDLWSQYASFLKKYYAYRDEKARLKGEDPADLSLYKVC